MKTKPFFYFLLCFSLFFVVVFFPVNAEASTKSGEFDGLNYTVTLNRVDGLHYAEAKITATPVRFLYGRTIILKTTYAYGSTIKTETKDKSYTDSWNNMFATVSLKSSYYTYVVSADALYYIAVGTYSNYVHPSLHAN